MPASENTLDPQAGTGITLDAALLAWEREVYEADPCGGQPHSY